MEGQEELGPVDIAVIGYPPGSPMTGDAMPLLIDLVERGIIRVLDVMFVMKDDDGNYVGFEAKDLDDKGVGEFTVFEGASSGLIGEDDVAEAAEVLDAGSGAVLIVYENRWAAPFIAAVRRNGGIPLAFERIPAAQLMETLDALEASEAATS
jgi:hypothetical protein